MKIEIKLSKKEKELYKQSCLSALGRYWGGFDWLYVGGGTNGDGGGYAFGVKFRKLLFKKLKELENGI